MKLVAWAWRRAKRLLGLHGPLKSFDHEVRSAGGVAGRVDIGVRAIAANKVVGSVGRWRDLRSDFFHRKGDPMTHRYYRIGEAMREGKDLPPLDVYKIKRDGAGPPAAGASEYYVVDGHHRVAMARKFRQDYLDARVVEVTLADTRAAPPAAEQPTPDGS